MANGGELWETGTEADHHAPHWLKTRCFDLVLLGGTGAAESGQNQVRFPQGPPWPAAKSPE